MRGDESLQAAAAAAVSAAVLATGRRDSRPERRQTGASAAKRNRGNGAPYARARRAQWPTAFAHFTQRSPPRAP